MAIDFPFSFAIFMILPFKKLQFIRIIEYSTQMHTDFE